MRGARTILSGASGGADEGDAAALNRSQAVIEFTLDGTILTANENFCSTMGYSLEAIRGKHHSMFAEPGYANTPEYRALWDKLKRGEFECRPVPARRRRWSRGLDPGFVQPDL